MQEVPDMLNIHQVIELTQISRTSIYDYMRKGAFPAAKKLTLRKVRWSKKEIIDWLKSRGFDIQTGETA